MIVNVAHMNTNSGSLGTLERRSLVISAIIHLEVLTLNMAKAKVSFLVLAVFVEISTSLSIRIVTTVIEEEVMVNLVVEEDMVFNMVVVALRITINLNVSCGRFSHIVQQCFYRFDQTFIGSSQF